jgi:hypothetical protein
MEIVLGKKANNRRESNSSPAERAPLDAAIAEVSFLAVAL